MPVLHRCPICHVLKAELIEGDRYRCASCGALVTLGLGRLLTDLEQVR